MSPIQTLVNEAHRMARRRLETGGAAVSSHKHRKANLDATDIVLPPDMDPVVIARALCIKLGVDEGDDTLWPLERKKLGGRVVLQRRHILRLGDGRFSEGRAYLHGLVRDMRAKRWRARFTTRR